MPNPKHRVPLILVVDDEHVIADTLGMILTHAGFSVIVAYTGEEALKLAGTHRIEMLISDVIMPGIDGFELAIQMKEALRSCGFLLISGQVATTERLEKVRQAGPNFEVLAKPVQPAEIIERVRDCVEAA